VAEKIIDKSLCAEGYRTEVVGKFSRDFKLRALARPCFSMAIQGNSLIDAKFRRKAEIHLALTW
jgi:hypothetical protein